MKTSRRKIGQDFSPKGKNGVQNANCPWGVNRYGGVLNDSFRYLKNRTYVNMNLFIPFAAYHMVAHVGLGFSATKKRFRRLHGPSAG